MKLKRVLKCLFNLENDSIKLRDPILSIQHDKLQEDRFWLILKLLLVL